MQIPTHSIKGSKSSSSFVACRYADHNTRFYDENDSDSVIEKTIGANGKMAILKRPHILNALDNTVVVPLFNLYTKWEADPSVGFIVVKGHGQAFCAGGDVIKIYHKLNQGRLEECKNIFALTFVLIHLTSSFSKPYVAIWNGVTIGSGSGISVHGRFRVATERTAFALPETQIGFHPDSGASYYLPRLSGYLGEYLALTGDRLNGAEMLACGLATHFTHTKNIPSIEEKLAELETKDPSAIGHLLDDFSQRPSLGKQSILNRMEMINECFGCDTVEEIIAAVESRATGVNHKWCNSILRKMKAASPLSLKISLRSIREGRFQTIEQCLIREYWMTVQAFHGNVSRDFFEGVRTRLLDKKSAPKWNPSSLNEVSNDIVNQYFLPLSPTEPPLALPTRQQTSLPSAFNWEKSLVMKKERPEAAVSANPHLRKTENPLPAKL